MRGNATLDVFIIAGIIAGGLGLLFVLARIGRYLWRLFQGIDDFLDDWRGEPPRPGVPARPGVMERLERVEQEVVAVRHEVTTNDGSSLKDAVKRVETKLGEVKKTLGTHLEGLED
ncbi:hypothetical protein HNP84_000235 [Thermocatellispora tengchongensis]|uniref:Uncharacterized protein n=1 Tax=Thermocatellispora tengchongensis TaxID=1073253 RepID=A0A840NZW5_9ACTN|nr:hypothetical protein [Thermocatellispora tengchongensis]MBB5130547.1 hypothetical protein [Thermocatellispora tengchongensis]